LTVATAQNSNYTKPEGRKIIAIFALADLLTFE
jgi:hypothetical protein